MEKTATFFSDLQSVTARFERESAQIRVQIATSAAAELAVKAISDEVAPLTDTELLKHEARINELIGAAVPPDGVLAALSAERRSDLERFLQTAGVSLVSCQCN